MNYTITQIADIVGGMLYGDQRTISAISTDSRSPLTAGAIFIALTTAKQDGHQYVSQMLSRGCTAFLVERLDTGWSDTTASFIVVSDTLQALQTLAAYHRSQFKGQVVAITGSNGKTIVKEWIAQLWDPANGVLIKSPRSYNSQLGVALSLLMIQGNERVAVIEAGISEPGEMERLQAMIRPTIGVLTNIGDAHGENFVSQTEKLNEKLILFKDCTHIVRGDLDTEPNIEKHNIKLVEQIYNLLGITHLPLSEIEPISLRLEVQQGIGDSEIINDSYNSDLTSIATALDFQRRTSKYTKRILIVSDVEQNPISPSELYAKVAQLVRDHDIDQIVGIGRQMVANGSLFDACKASFHNSTNDFLQTMQAMDFAHSSVLLKGARSFGFERISHAMELRTHATTLEVNLTQLVENYNNYHKYIDPRVKTMAMVKASSYGAGGALVAQKLIEAGVSYLAVAFADEGIALRQAGITTPIVVLNSDPGSFAAMLQYDLEPEIYSFDSLDQYTDTARKQGITQAKIHIKLDTGMHRLGFMPDQIDTLCETLLTNPTVNVMTIFSHLSSAEDPKEDDFTRSQIALFRSMSDRLIQGAHITDCMLSLANSAATERFKDAHFDIVRIGIGLYKNISTLRTRITQVKTVDAGQSVGYNRRSICDRPTRLAIIPIGYADGMDRRLGCGNGMVNIGGELCPTIGNICMDTTIVDTTDLTTEVRTGDEVIIFGPNSPTADDLAKIMHTISYEIITSISPRIKRLYIAN